MTREKFETEARCWGGEEFTTFCSDNGYDQFIEKVYSSDARDDYIDEVILDCSGGWRDMLRELESYEEEGEYAYWVLDDVWGEWIGLEGDTLNDLIDDLIEALEEDGFFEDDEETEEWQEADVDITNFMFGNFKEV